MPETSKQLSKTDRYLAWLIRGLLAAFCWWLISEGRNDSWVLGAPAVVLAVVFSFYLQPASGYRLSLPGILAFWWYFSRQSLVAGYDVAKRIISPEMPIQPGEVTLKLHLPAGAPRWLLAMTLSLLPGTLSVRFEGDSLVLHCLDIGEPVEVDVLTAERRVAAVFGLSGAALIRAREPLL
ncbi:multicomponent Na+:H+ antiporter subunit E [Marinospirillum celere]|uniref:Multicomponent Na+:H+ antiporter subunit E n=1 Tax=Marinospirillum celere TaxID=1122252 RepID=A0A1I1FUA5_9GAMM|nr:Na+/H+ antiporter subunit E [Marinospirillum celere]SFC01218.1 multicomponent Na+:H+ antiporter subunit E [Marinospirillum celere]